jgi:ribosomal protein S18 acetylase RimI-like enzyme
MGIEGYRLDSLGKAEGDETLWQQSADLMYGAFDWPISRGKVRELIRTDPRHAVDPVATYATDPKGDLVGYVGISRRPVVHEGETIPSGHLWTVAVRHDHTRKGLGRTLLEMAVEQLRSEGIEEITLYSTPGLVAYPIYRDLGFCDHHRLAFWFADARPGIPDPDLRFLTEEEQAIVGDLFHTHLEGMDGFSVREGDPYAGYRAMGADLPSWLTTIDPPGTMDGYIFMNPSPMRGLTSVTEIIGPDPDWYRKAINAVRARAKGDQVWVTHRNPAAKEGLEAAGLRWNDVHAFERMMAVGRIVEGDEARSDPGWFLESRYDVF